MPGQGKSDRRTVLKAIGTSTAATTALGFGVQTAAAETDPSNAQIKERVFVDATSGFGYDQWDSMRYRIYGTNMYDGSTVEAVSSDVATWCQNVVNLSDQINEYRVVGRTTNIDPFAQDQILADQYVEEFGHDYYGGGNLWLDEGGSAWDKAANGPTGPEPYRNRNDDSQASYPHAWKADGKVDGIYWAAAHECAHLLSREQYWGTSLSNTDGDHELATEKYFDATVFTRPSIAEHIEEGDCTGSEALASSHSLKVSNCAVTAFEDSTDGWRYY